MSQARDPSWIAARKLGDRYLLEQPIGTGSMGTVYRARDEVTGRTVAVKCLRSMDAADVLRFEREFLIVSELRHPCVVACWGAAKTASGEAYFVMDWLAGETLRERLLRSELTLSETVELAIRVLAGLACAHASQVVHRDVKPANIFLEGAIAGRAKLLDFGIARRVTAGDTLTAIGQFIGTPGYVAPEQIRSERVDVRADLYSVGCVMFRCLAGRAVFEDENMLDLLVRVTRDRAPALAVLRADLPPSLTSLVDRMLERAPIDRPANAAEVLRELELLDLAQAGATSAPLLPARQTPDSVDRPPPALEKGTSLSRPTAMNASAEVRPATRAGKRAAWLRVLPVLAFAALLPVAYLAANRQRVDEAPSAATAAAPAVSSDAFGPEEERVGKDARAAWGAIRMGARASALRRLTERVSGGTAGGSERLWLALLSNPGEPARRSFRDAVARTEELTAFERAVVDAATPLFATPTDFAAADKAIAELVASTTSPELSLVLDRLRIQRNDRRGADAALSGASDARWAVAVQIERMYIAFEFFDVETARSAALACLAQRPDAVDCVAFLARRAAVDGDCQTMEAHARKWVGIDPDDPQGYEMLAFALAARGEKDEALREAFEQKWARLPEHDRLAAKLADLVLLDATRGRFDDAAARARQVLDALPADAPLLQRLGASFGAILVATETRNEKHVAEISGRVLERASAATPATATDAAYFLLFAAVARGFGGADPRWEQLGTATFARYELYLASQGENLRPYQRVLPWIVGYAAGAHSDERLKAAYDALPRYGSLPPPGARGDDVDLVIGNVLARNGERARGLTYLKRAAHSCLLLENPYAVLRARNVLGIMLEQEKDVPGARRAYESVLSVWQEAKPKSATAVSAKKSLERLRRAAKTPS